MRRRRLSVVLAADAGGTLKASFSQSAKIITFWGKNKDKSLRDVRDVAIYRVKLTGIAFGILQYFPGVEL